MHSRMIVLSSGSLYTYGLDRVFNLARDVGFDGLELMVDHRWDTRHVGYLKVLMARYGLPILAVHSPFAPSVPGWPADEPGRIRRSVQLAEQVGARVVVAHLPLRVGRWLLQGRGRRLLIPVPWSGQGGYRRWLLEELAGFHTSSPVVVAIENMPAWRILNLRLNPWHWNDVQSVAQFSHLTMDTTHLGTWGIDPTTAYEVWGERVAHVHLSDFDGREHQLPGTGRLALDRLLQRLAADGYKGIITLELNPKSLQADEEERVRENLAMSLAFCRTYFE